MQYSYRKSNINYWISLPNINEDDNTKIQNAIKEMNKGECITMENFNHGHTMEIFREYRGEESEDQQFLVLVQGNFLTQHVLGEDNVLYI